MVAAGVVRLTRSSRPNDYVELHCHSCFSLLGGAALPEVLAARAANLGMPALALTDHNELGGAVRFAQATSEVGIGGIIGAEVTVAQSAERGARSVSAARTTHNALRSAHLVLLAETREGYGNLSTLITRARMENSRGEPCVSLELLAQHANGLFALTGCPRGWVPSLVAEGDVDGACEAAAVLSACSHLPTGEGVPR